MADPSASNPDQPGENAAEVAGSDTVRPVRRKKGQSGGPPEPLKLHERAQPAAPSSLAALPTTPLQRLLDPAQALLGRSTPLQGARYSGLNLPAWDNLQTHGTIGEILHTPVEAPVEPVLTVVLPAPPPPPALAIDDHFGPPLGAVSERAAPTPAPDLRSTALQPTLDESVVEALIQALYDALPAELEEPTWEQIPETTTSGNLIGRHQTTLSPLPTRLIRHAAPDQHPSLPDLPDPEVSPKQFSRGVVDDATLRVTRESLSALELEAPGEDAAHSLQVRTVLGVGEACYLRAQSALWAWRTHRQQNLYLHTDGPPSVGRNALIEQRIGPVTLLIGCRVTELTENDRSWGFTLVSLSGQVLRSHETFLVDWQENGEVVFTCTSLQQISAPSLAFLGRVHSALRRLMIQGYTRNMIEMSADADLYE